MAMPDYSTYTKAELEAALAATTKAIKNKGGPKNAPNYAKRRQAIKAVLASGNYGAGRDSGGSASAPAPAPAPPSTPEEQVQDTTSRIRVKNPETAVKAEQEAADLQAQRNIGYFNPSQFGPGGSQVVTLDENGNPVVTTTLSPEQQAIYDRGAALSGQGLDFAFNRLSSGGFNQAFDPELMERWTSGDLAADRERIEGEVFDRLTRGLDEDQGNAVKSKEQELFNKGIPYSSDPNSRYQREMDDINERFDMVRTDARQRAAEIGGQEYSRAFGINEQTIANQLSQAQGIRNQNLGEISGFSNLGPGLQTPNFSPWQAPPAYDPASPLEAFYTMAGIRDQNKRRQLDRYIAELNASTNQNIAGINANTAITTANIGANANQGNPEDDVFLS